MEAQMLDLVHGHLDAFSTSDWRRYGAILAPDVVYDDVGIHKRSIGAAGYLAAVQRWKRAFPDLTATVLRSFAVGNSVMAEVEWTGTHLGPFELGTSLLAATRRSVMFRSAVFYAISCRTIREARHYYDALTLVAQLGQSPIEPLRRTFDRPHATPLIGGSHR